MSLTTRIPQAYAVVLCTETGAALAEQTAGLLRRNFYHNEGR